MVLDSAKIEACVTRICELGCASVNHLIEDLCAGRERPEYAGLDEEERGELLRELSSVMSVYRD